MSDLKTFWQPGELESNQSAPAMGLDVDLGGDTVISRGNDPLIADAPRDESPNSVSGLPLRPNRLVSSESVSEPPTLEDRNPGTIDKK